MSQATAKASRRDIRKAFGSEAVDLLARHNEAVNFTGATVQALVLRVAELEGRTERLESLDAIVAALIPLVQVDGGFCGIEPSVKLLRRPLWGRLRWLATGK